MSPYSGAGLVRQLLAGCLAVFAVCGEARAAGGAALAAVWCGGCHAAPEPAALDRATWTRHVLPEMGARLGIHEFRGRRWRPDPSLPAGTYPTEPLLPLADWAKIFDHYRDGALAERLPAAPPPERTTGRFAVRLPPPRTDREYAAVTALLVDEEARRVLVGDAAGRRVRVHDRALRPVAEVPVDSPPVHFAPLDGGAWLVTLIGSLAPGEAPRGAVVRLDPPRAEGEGWRVTRLLRRLPRPVRTLAADLDRDGRGDLVVAGFGHARGAISLHLSRPGGGYGEPLTLLGEPGAVSLALRRGDLHALMAQGDERIVRFPAAVLARAAAGEAAASPAAAVAGPSGAAPPSGRASPEILRRFPPERGSSSMRVLDFDGDGSLDLLVTAGDNADFTPVFKRGHGIRLYLGDRRGGFRLALFHRLDGAYGAVAEDFDADGDRDIAAVAWFADYSRGPDGAAGFVYLENLGAAGFRPARVPGLERLGRFAVIEAGDVTGDGVPDVVLGNLAYGAPGPGSPPPALTRAWAAGPRFVVLEARPPGVGSPPNQEP